MKRVHRELAEKQKNGVFCFFLIVRVLVFLFFIDRYSSVYHLPMINLTKLTVTRRRVYPKMTTFKNARNCFTGALLVGSAEVMIKIKFGYHLL